MNGLTHKWLQGEYNLTVSQIISLENGIPINVTMPEGCNNIKVDYQLSYSNKMIFESILNKKTGELSETECVYEEK